MSRAQLREEKTAVKPREHPHGQEEAGLGGDPPLAIGGKAAPWDNAMKVRMMGHRRAPGVEHGGKADACAEMFRIGGDGAQGLGCGLEQEIVDYGLVLIGDLTDGGR